MSLQNSELVPMETSNALVPRNRPHEVSIPPSSPSDTAMTLEAGGDPTQISMARGDPELQVDAVNQELRDELAEMRHSYNLEVHASRMRSQALSTRYSTQAWKAIQYQNERFQETAQQYEQASADVTEAAVAQERAAQRAHQQQQLNGYQSVLLQVESRVHQHEHMLQQAQRDHAEALAEQFSDALAEERARIVTEAEAVLIQEQLKQQQIKAEYMRSLAQTHAAADIHLQQAYDTIQGLQCSIQKHEMSQAELHGIINKMQNAIEKQNLHINVELDSAHKHHESEVRQFQAQQARQAQDVQRQQMEREQKWRNEISKLTADLHQSQIHGQVQAQRANTLQDQILAEQRLPTTPSFSPATSHPQPRTPPVHHPSPVAEPPPPEPSLDFFASVRTPAGGDPMQAGGDSTQELPKAPQGQEPPSAARGDPSIDPAWGDPSAEDVPPDPHTAQGGAEQQSRIPPGFESKLHSASGHIFLREAPVLNFEKWPVYHRFEIWKSNFYREIAAKSGQNQSETMMWIKEIEVATDIQSLITPTSKYGQKFETLDMKIATGLWKILNGDFEKKLQIEERILQQSTPHAMLTGRQVAYRIFQHFSLPEARTAYLNITHLCALRVQKDDLRLYDLQWDEILLKIDPEPPADILATIYQGALETCGPFKPTMNLYWLNVAQGMIKPSYQALKRMVKFYLQDAQNKQHEATLKANQPGLAMPAVAAVNKKEVTCQQMASTGKCSRGDRCPWGHSIVGPIKRSRSSSTKGNGKGKKGKNKDKDKRDKSPIKPDPSAAKKATTGTSPSGKPNRPVCRNYKKGTCKRGDKCDNYHVPICKFYPHSCRRGEACQYAHHDQASSTPTPAKQKGALAITDGSLAGLAMTLPSDEIHPMACMAGGDPCANTPKAKGDLRTKAHFSRRAKAKAKTHRHRNTLQPCGRTRPSSPSTRSEEEIKLTLSRERVARRRAWHLAKGINKSMGKFDDTDVSFFKIPDPEKNSNAEPLLTAAYAARRSFVIDSGASHHLIGFNKLTPKEKGSIRSIAEPQRLQSANGIVTVDKEVHIFVPALNMSVWAQLIDDCPAILSLGVLCSKQGWTYEWQSGQDPTLSKGTKKITLTQVHDVPMVFAARQEQGVTPCEEEGVRPPSLAAAEHPSEGTSSTSNGAGHVSDTVGEGGPLHAGEGRPCASTDGGEPDSATRSQSGTQRTATRSKSTQRQKQRIVKSKFSVPASARHNQYTHFPLDMNCEICKLVKIPEQPANQARFRNRMVYRLPRTSGIG